MHPYSQATQDLNISGGKISSYLLVFKEITLTCLKIQVYIKDLIQTSSTEQLRTIIRYLLDTLLSLLHSSNGLYLA